MSAASSTAGEMNRRQLSTLLSVFLALFSALPFLGCGPRLEGTAGHTRGAKGERIVLITVDTLRQDSFLGAAGRETTMPLTRSRAQAGAWFPHFFAATSSTQPSHASMLTGLHPWEHGVSRNGQRLSDQVETVAELLHQAGWSTGAAVASFPLAAQFGFDQGFEFFDDRFHHDFGTTTWGERTVPRRRFYNLAKRMTDKALHTLSKLDGDRQLLWVHYFDPHAPYGKTVGQAARPIDAFAALAEKLPVDPVVQELRDLYDRDVSELDGQLDRLLERLEEDADRFTTHIILASDHGESFGEDG